MAQFLPLKSGHYWLAEQIDRPHYMRGTRLNVLGPRGGAKSTIGALALPLRAALEQREPYIWIVSDTAHQACAHLENIKTELVDNPSLAQDYPDAVGPGASNWRQRLRAKRHRHYNRHALTGSTIEA